MIVDQNSTRNRDAPSNDGGSAKKNAFTFGVNSNNMALLDERSSNNNDAPTGKRPSSEENSRNAPPREIHGDAEVSPTNGSFDKRHESQPPRASKQTTVTQNTAIRHSHNQSADVHGTANVQEDVKQNHFTSRNSEDKHSCAVKVKDESISRQRTPSECIGEGFVKARENIASPCNPVASETPDMHSAGKQEGDLKIFSNTVDTLSPRIPS